MKFTQHSKMLAVLSVGVGLVGLTGVVYAVPQELVDGLGDESYQLREKSEKDLTLWAREKGEKGLTELDKMKEKVTSPEVRSRLENVMSGVTVYKAVPGTRGFMGISMQAVMGASVINAVTANTPAEKAGLQPNDKIIELDGVDLTKKNRHVDEATDFLRTYVKSKKAGEKLTVKIERGGKKLTKELKLADYDTQMGLLDPFGNGMNGGIEILPMQGGLQGRIQIAPRPKNLNQNELKEEEILRLEMNMKRQAQMLNGAELPEEFKKLLERQNELNKARIELLKKEREEGKKKFLKK
ncbi:MAG: PDZ domain-containing protein [Akkermansiaceae bacterium]